MSKETAKISVEEIKDRITSQLSSVVVQEWVASGVYVNLVEHVSAALACELNVPVTVVNELMKEHLAKRLVEDEDVTGSTNIKALDTDQRNVQSTGRVHSHAFPKYIFI